MGSIYKKAIKAYEIIFGKLNLDTFDGRLKFQKTIYFLKILGVNFQELNFTWYKRGPYCFDLVGVQYKESQVENDLSTKEENKILENKEKIKEIMQTSEKAELFSSVAYLLVDEKLQDDDIVKRMDLVKPWFKKEEVEEAIKEAKILITHNN